ncbi:hypothetical protein [Haloarchaeobius sp. HME9146]|uniref:hypothetical protein n=1 Tax=Haloarchaeobius sp. HME9146 TaxID=2978732 RepID=UPI0021C05EBD|nr:hypothetical protein [Haloarchaeobius sp. HME9146]MCT9094703.1 hypothetical protein [Haloarchaeobius sp. HME9146]
MSDENPTRRTTLKTLSSLGVAGAGLATASSHVTATPETELPYEPDKKWGTSTIVTDGVLEDSNPFGQACALGWYGATDEFNDDQWVHELVLLNLATVNQDLGAPGIDSIVSTIEPSSYSNVTITGNITGAHDQAFPNTTGDLVPDWLEVPAKFVLGLMRTSLSVAFGIEGMIEKFSPKNGWQSTSNGYKFRHGTPWYATWNWGSAGTALRFQVRVPKGGQQGVTLNTKTHRGEIWADEPQSDFDITFFGDGSQPYVSTDGSCFDGSSCEEVTN